MNKQITSKKFKQKRYVKLKKYIKKIRFQNLTLKIPTVL